MDSKRPAFLAHRIGAVVVALVLWAFAILGFLSGTGFVATQGMRALGMTGNGLLSTISVVVGVVLAVVAVLGGPVASTVCVVVGGLFVLSGLLNLIVLNGPANVLAFTMPNIVFSLVVGLILLTIDCSGVVVASCPRTTFIGRPVAAATGCRGSGTTRISRRNGRLIRRPWGGGSRRSARWLRRSTLSPKAWQRPNRSAR
jgi:hypothetical protein